MKTYVTLLSSDDFLPGVVMLAWSLTKVKSVYPLLVLCSDSISFSTYKKLKKYNLQYQTLDNHIIVDDEINKDKGYAHWNKTFDKLYVWSLTQFEKVVFLDSDMQVVRNIDFLFDCLHMSAVRADKFNEPGIDKLNSGLMVIEPNEKDFQGLCAIASSGVIKLRNMGDQDIIRAYYKDWGCHLDLTLESGLNVFYSEVSRGIIKEIDVEPVSVIHYIGSKKPWMVSPRAIWRRSKGSFLRRHLLRYSVALYCRFPLLLFVRAKS